MSLGVSSRSSSRRETKSKKKDFTFTINTFSLLFIKTGQKILSCTFDSGISDEIKCYLEIYPHGYSEELKDFSSIYLCFEGFVKLPMPIEVEFYTLSENRVKEDIKKVKETDNFLTINRLGIDQFTKLDKCCRNFYSYFGGVQPKEITVGCEISLIYESSTIDTPSKTKKVEKRSWHILDDINRMLKLSQLSDCTIKVGNVKIKAHKCILASRSDSFLSIFKNKETKTKSNMVRIKDFRPEVVKEMITYMYTETSPSLNTMASELLMIATNYSLKGLKNMAEESLCNSLTVTNSCNYLELSELYTAKLLKECCKKFICKNAKDITKNKKWTDFVIKNPLLLDELFKCSIEIGCSSTNQQQT